jgi:AcrR family transcriptional regulator
VTRARRSLTRTQVLETALAVVDAEGLAALSMRRLGKELGVEAMSLYHHVRDKDDLVNGVNLLVLGRLDVDSDGMTWPEAIEAFALRMYEAYLPRPDLARALSWTTPSDGDVLVTMERVVARLAESGLPPEVQVSAFRGVISMCVGFVVVHTEPQPMSDSVRWTGWGDAAPGLTSFPSLTALAPTFDRVPVADDVTFMIRAVIAALVQQAT